MKPDTGFREKLAFEPFLQKRLACFLSRSPREPLPDLQGGAALCPGITHFEEDRFPSSVMRGPRVQPEDDGQKARKPMAGSGCIIDRDDEARLERSLSGSGHMSPPSVDPRRRRRRCACLGSSPRMTEAGARMAALLDGSVHRGMGGWSVLMAHCPLSCDFQGLGKPSPGNHFLPHKGGEGGLVARLAVAGVLRLDQLADVFRHLAAGAVGGVGAVPGDPLGKRRVLRHRIGVVPFGVDLAHLRAPYRPGRPVLPGLRLRARSSAGSS